MRAAGGVLSLRRWMIVTPTVRGSRRTWSSCLPSWNRRGGRGGDGWSGVDSGDTEIGKAVGVHRETVRRIRKELWKELHPM